MPNGALYWAEDQEAYPLDVEMANQLMSESNSPDGISISLTIPAGNSLSTQIATALKDMWSAINVELAIEQLDPSVLRDNFLANEFESVLSGWTNDIIDPDELVSYTILPESNENYHSGWINQDAIDLAHQAQVELDPDKRRDLYAEIQQIHKDDGPFVYLYVIPYIDALNKRVTGFFHHPMGQYVFANMSVTE
jgi:peptide/nickel transport system substrate-binding protein